jgi:hypothetical protein
MESGSLVPVTSIAGSVDGIELEARGIMYRIVGTPHCIIAHASGHCTLNLYSPSGALRTHRYRTVEAAIAAYRRTAAD